METFTVSIPKELKKKLDSHLDINWAEYLKIKFEHKLKELKRFQELRSNGAV